MSRRGLCLAIMAVISPAAFSQTLPRPERFDPSIYFGGFNFSGPGARAMAMGTAFIGLADDATASEWNPAGLHVILKPEVFLQLKSAKYESPLLVPYNNLLAENGESVNNLTYASYAQVAGRFAFSVYRQELVSYRAQGSFLSSGEQLYGTPAFDFTSSIDLDMKVVNYGTSGAMAFADNKLSVGYSLRYGILDVESNFRQDFFKRTGGESSAVVSDGDTDLSFNAGFLWKPTPKFSLGMVYKSGPVFEVEQVQTFGTFLKPTPPNTFSEKVPVVVPDSYGLGIAFRPSDQLTVAVDAVRVNYEDLNVSLERAGDTPDFLLGRLAPAKNGVELHAGLEYVILTKNPVSLRIGAYTEPDHRSVIVAQGEDDLHYTGGLGFVVGSRFQLDVAANLSDFTKEYLLSGIFRWGK